MNSVFVSYLRNDSELVSKLVADLRREGINVWFDRDRITPGSNWAEALHTAIANDAFFIPCFSPTYYQRTETYMEEEIRIASLAMQRKAKKAATIIPVLLQPCEIPAVPITAQTTLRDLQWVDLTSNWNEGVWRLLDAVRPINQELRALDIAFSETLLACD